jgi:hypothetical protein
MALDFVSGMSNPVLVCQQKITTTSHEILALTTGTAFTGPKCIFGQQKITMTSGKITAWRGI